MTLSKKKKVESGERLNSSRKGFEYELKKNLMLFAMLLPGLVFLILNNYLPMFGVFIAFKDINYAKGIFGSDWVGFENFDFFMKSSYAPIIFRNTLLYNVAFIIIGTAVPVILAILLNELRNKRLAKCYQTAMFLPYFLSWIVVSYIVFGFLGQEFGYINNSVLNKLGIEPIAWYNEPKYWPYLIVFFNLWKYSGYNSVVYLASVVNIDNGYYEAALIDGATKWQQTKSITIPMLSPIIIIMVIMNVGKIFKADFGLFYQVPMNSGSLFPVTNVIDTYVYRAGLVSGDIGLGSAAGLFQSVIGFILVLITNSITKKIDNEKALF